MTSSLSLTFLVPAPSFFAPPEILAPLSKLCVSGPGASPLWARFLTQEVGTHRISSQGCQKHPAQRLAGSRYRSVSACFLPHRGVGSREEAKFPTPSPLLLWFLKLAPRLLLGKTSQLLTSGRQLGLLWTQKLTQVPSRRSWNTAPGVGLSLPSSLCPGLQP